MMPMLRAIPVRRYLWEVYRELPGSRKQRKQIISRVEQSVRDYASENPRISYRGIKARFGSPQQIAESCIAEMETSEIREELKFGWRLRNIILAGVTLAVLIWFGFVAWAYYDHTEYVNGYGVIEVEVIEQTESDGGGK